MKIILLYIYICYVKKHCKQRNNTFFWTSHITDLLSRQVHTNGPRSHGQSVSLVLDTALHFNGTRHLKLWTKALLDLGPPCFDAPPGGINRVRADVVLPHVLKPLFRQLQQTIEHLKPDNRDTEQTEQANEHKTHM